MDCYRDAITHLFSLRRFGIRPGLSTITRLLGLLGNPERERRFVHIAGTNGKGSTASFLHAVLLQCGYRPGLYTSPHLVDFCERIRTGETLIAQEAVVEYTRHIRRVCDVHNLDQCTFFEYATAMALMHFRDTNADPVIMEAGLGGRYDATNCISPLVSIITQLGIDHQQYLGDTLDAIAHEKAGIIKPGAPLVSAAESEDIIGLFDDACRRVGVPHVLLGREFFSTTSGLDRFDYTGMRFNLPGLCHRLRGHHQAGNAALAAAAAEVLLRSGYTIRGAAIRKGIATARWPGRFDLVSHKPLIVIDGAHNAPAWQCLAQNLICRYPGSDIVIVAAVMQDKDIGAFMQCFVPLCRTMILCRPEVERAAGREFFAKFIRFSDEKKILWAPDPGDALNLARALVASDGLICVTGSLYLAGTVYRDIGRDSGRETSGLIPL
jgi:dihydrofolate synthase / folylpolyglutamate synthase